MAQDLATVVLEGLRDADIVEFNASAAWLGAAAALKAAPARAVTAGAWDDARSALVGLTDPEARILALLACPNARVRDAAVRAMEHVPPAPTE